jgi:hypothetical protein
MRLLAAVFFAIRASLGLGSLLQLPTFDTGWPSLAGPPRSGVPLSLDTARLGKSVFKLLRFSRAHARLGSACHCSLLTQSDVRNSRRPKRLQKGEPRAPAGACL